MEAFVVKDLVGFFFCSSQKVVDVIVGESVAVFAAKIN